VLCVNVIAASDLGGLGLWDVVLTADWCVSEIT
jgi:hypothetical protein